MEYGRRFKRSLFGGFKRRDVLQCFDEYAAEKADEISELTARIEDLQKKLSEGEAAVARAKEENEQAQKDQAALREKLSEYEKILELQKTQLLSASENKSRAEAESKASLQLLKERDVKIAFLEDKTQKLTLKLEESERKGKKYDSLSVQIGEMMLEAKSSAEGIIRQAEARSVQMTAEASQAVDRLSADLNLFLEQLNHIKTTMHSLTDGVDTKIQSLEASISSTQDNLSSFQKTQPTKQPELRPEPPAPEKHAEARRGDTAPEQKTAESEQNAANRIGKTINRLIDLIGRD